MARHGVQIILCIGLEKTGTTSLQKACGKAREILLQNGVLYPDRLGRDNHIDLAAYAQEDYKSDNVRKSILARRDIDLATFRRQVERNVVTISSRTDYDRVMFSNEHLHSRITVESELRRLKALLEQIGSDFRIAVILRRQDRVAESLLSTMIKGGRINLNPVLPRSGALPLFYRYYDLLDMYENVFGSGTVHAGIYEDQTYRGGYAF